MSIFFIYRARPATTWFLVTALLVLATKAASATDSLAIILEHSPSSNNSALPEGVDTETGFRMEHYRRPVPVSNPGTETVDTTRALQLQRSGKVLLIDVYPPRGLGADPIDGHRLTNEKHESLPAATWLPEVGRGHVEKEHIDYFTRNLKLLTKDDKTTPIMFTAQRTAGRAEMLHAERCSGVIKSFSGTLRVLMDGQKKATNWYR